MTNYEKSRILSIGRKVQSGYVSPVKFLILCPVILVAVVVASVVGAVKQLIHYDSVK